MMQLQASVSVQRLASGDRGYGTVSAKNGETSDVPDLSRAQTSR